MENVSIKQKPPLKKHTEDTSLQNAIKEAKRQREDIGWSLGHFHVVKFGDEYHPVADGYLKIHGKRKIYFSTKWNLFRRICSLVS